MDVVLCLPHDCQLRCNYCYAGNKQPARMSWETARLAADLAFSEPDNPYSEVRKISFFGGEPLLEWDLLQQVVTCVRQREAASARPVHFAVTTNGLGLWEDRLRFLRNENFDVCLSFDGCRAAQDAARRFADGTSSFKPTEAAVRAALAHFPELEVVSVVSPRNVRHLAESVEFLAGLGAQKIILNPDYYSHWSDEELEAWRAGYEQVGEFFLRQCRHNRPCYISFLVIKMLTKIHGKYEVRHFCDYGGRYMAVAPSGRLYPCQRTVGEDVDEAMCLGDVRQGIKRDLQRHFMECRGACNPECAQCVLRPRCRNWCSCINYAVGGDLAHTPGIVCFHERTAIEVADTIASTLYAEKNPLFMRTFYREDTAWHDWK